MNTTLPQVFVSQVFVSELETIFAADTQRSLHAFGAAQNPSRNGLPIEWYTIPFDREAPLLAEDLSVRNPQLLSLCAYAYGAGFEHVFRPSRFNGLVRCLCRNQQGEYAPVELNGEHQRQLAACLAAQKVKDPRTELIRSIHALGKEHGRLAAA